MQAVIPPLDDLRAEIDRIDQQILELLIDRTEVVRAIARLKDDRRSGRAAMRPAREAMILRQLIASAGDRFPPAVAVRMWRELIAAQTRLQTPLSVSVFVPAGTWTTWDLARDHFGALTPMTRVDNPSQAVRAVGNGDVTVAVLPLPNDEDGWWPSLLSSRHDRLRVFGRLPFFSAGAADGEEAQALAIGRLEPEASGDDLTLLAIEAERDVSRGRLRDLLLRAELTPVWCAVWRSPKEPQTLHMVEVPGLVLDGDDRIGRTLASARGEILRIVPLGGYPRPLRSNRPE